MSNQTAIPFIQMRGGSSKGIYFHRTDLPNDSDQRNAVLKWVMGAHGDARQIDGLGGANPLTSKIAIISPSKRDDSDIDYKFIQAIVGEDRVDDTPNCGNILSGVGAFSIETGLVKPTGNQARIRVYMTNSGNRCLLKFPLENGQPIYHGDTCIDGVIGSSAAIMCLYQDLEGSACGSLCPTGNQCDEFDNIRVTCIDNGMPVVCLRAKDFGLIGSETPDQLNTNKDLRVQLESIRLKAGLAMGLGDVSGKAIPKMCLVSRPRHGGTINTHTFIPKQCHKAIGVLGAVSVGTAALLQDSVIRGIADFSDNQKTDKNLEQMIIEHPSGSLTVELEMFQKGGQPMVKKAGLLRTTRMLCRGEVYIPKSVWDGNTESIPPK